MQDVRVTHIGGVSLIENADFRTDEGDLIVFRSGEIVAQFAASKWSAAIKADVPATRTR
jgi:hypothetical protein